MAYPTNAALKTFLGISGSSEDPLLTELVNGAISFVEKHTSREFVATGDETLKFFPIQKVHFPALSTLLFRRDLAQVTSVTDSTWGALTNETNYILLRARADLPAYGLQLLDRSWSRAGTRYVTIVGRWAYSVDVPADLYTLICEIAAYFYRGRNSGDAGQLQLTPPSAGIVIRPSALPANLLARLEVYRR